MKKLLYFIPAVIFFVACGEGGSMGSGKSLPLATLADSMSYAIGINNSDMLKKVNEDVEGEYAVNLDLYGNGIREGVAGNPRMTEEEVKATLTQLSGMLQKAAQSKQQAEAAKNIAIGETFLAENATKEGVVTTPSGLQYKIIEAGTGASPAVTDQVTVHYTGKLIDGTVFDSSVKRGQPYTTGLDQVIRGWTEGIPLMKVGAKYEFYIPSSLGYGPQGNQGIPGNAVLIFEVDLLDIVK